MLRIIQMQICKLVGPMTGELYTRPTVYGITIYGLGLDGRVYRYDEEEKHWTPITTRRVNPLHKQPRKQRINIDDEKEGGVL